MNIYLIAIGNRMPSWVTSGYEEYAKRLGQDCTLHLIEIAANKRGKNMDIKRVLQTEGEQMLKAIPKNSSVIALDVQGQQWDTPTLAEKIKHWQHDGRSISLLIGGPEGLAPACLARTEQTWSLSKLTFPHPLVRIIIAEQIYRAWSLLHGHPYHRS